MNKKLKIFIENISTLRSLGVKDFVIVDANENFANVVLLRASANPLKIFTISKPPNYKILSQRECKTTEDNIFELNREIRILSEKHKLKNAVLLLLINKYKYFNISLQKEDSDADEEISIGDLIRKQLPSNLNNSEFILHFEKISEDETLNSYLVTITRKQDIEKYSNVIYNDAFQLKFALPSIFTIANQKPVKDKVHTLIDIQRERLIHYQSVNEIKITEDEYFIDPEMGFEQSVIERIGEIITGISSTREEGSEQQFKMHFQSPLELTSIITNAMLKINSGRENLIAYENNQAIKHNLAFRSLFNDSILDFDIEKHFQSKISFDLERAVTTRFVIGAFSILLLLLLFLNAMNLITNNSLSDISMQKENQKQLAIQVKVTSEKNEQLKTDIKSLSKIKYKGESVSGLLKIVSLASIDKLQLNDLKIKRNNSDKYEVKLSGESSSKDEVISLIKNLESNTELSSIELIWMDKKKDGSYQVKKSLFDFQFSINMIYNENKNS